MTTKYKLYCSLQCGVSSSTRQYSGLYPPTVQLFSATRAWTCDREVMHEVNCHSYWWYSKSSHIQLYPLAPTAATLVLKTCCVDTRLKWSAGVALPVTKMRLPYVDWNAVVYAVTQAEFSSRYRVPFCAFVWSLRIACRCTSSPKSDSITEQPCHSVNRLRQRHHKRWRILMRKR